MKKQCGVESETKHAFSVKIAYEQEDGLRYEAGQPLELEVGDELVKREERIRLVECVYSDEASDSSGWMYVVVGHKTPSGKWKNIKPSMSSHKKIIHDFTGWTMLAE